MLCNEGGDPFLLVKGNKCDMKIVTKVIGHNWENCRKGKKPELKGNSEMEKMFRISNRQHNVQELEFNI